MDTNNITGWTQVISTISQETFGIGADAELSPWGVPESSTDNRSLPPHPRPDRGEPCNARTCCWPRLHRHRAPSDGAEVHSGQRHHDPLRTQHTCPWPSVNPAAQGFPLSWGMCCTSDLALEPTGDHGRPSRVQLWTETPSGAGVFHLCF